MYLVDTNVLLRIVSPQSQDHITERSSVKKLKEGGDPPVAAAQNFIEAGNVATRPLSRNVWA